MTTTNKLIKSILLSIVAGIAAILMCFAFVGCGDIGVSDVGGNTDVSTPNDTDDNKPNEGNTDNNDNKPEPIVYTEGLAYEKIKSGGYVVGYSVVGIGEAKDTKIVIPAEYEEKPVTAIADKAFEDCYKLTEIILPDTITEIKDAFGGCEKLTYNVYGNAKYLGTADNPHFALIEKESDDITVCTVHQDTRITAWYAFNACKSFNRVNYLGTVEDWCKIDFGGNFGNPLERAHNLYINNELVTELVIPSSVTEIKQHQFESISASKIVFPRGIKSIGYAAFCQSSVTTVYLSGDIEFIDKYAFMMCKDLTTVTIKGQDDLKLGEAAFAFCDNLKTVTIDADYAELGKDVCSGCDTLRTVTLRGIGMNIGSGAFQYCNELTTFNIFGTPAKIGSEAFANKLTTINFNNTWTWWSTVDKDRYWLGFSSIYPEVMKIVCTDGTHNDK